MLNLNKLLWPKDKPYWQVRYRDGKIVSEWDVKDWGEITRRGIVEARLVCPNGKIGVLGMQGKDCSDRFFQFKIAKRSLFSTSKSTVEAYVLGIVYGTNGQSIVYSWEPEYVNEEGKIINSGRLLGPFEDVFPFMSYGGPVTSFMNSEMQGIRS